MSIVASTNIARRRSKSDQLFLRASKQEEQGKLRSAFRLYLAAAKLGDSSCQINLGNFYADGRGVKPNRVAAISWYKKAYRQGERSAAANLGALFRDEGKFKEALTWFKRAVDLNDGDANLEIAKIYLLRGAEREKVVRYLREVEKSSPSDVTKASKKEANLLLKKLSQPGAGCPTSRP